MSLLWAKHSGVPRSDGELEDAFPRTYTPARGYAGARHVAVGGPKDVMMSIDEKLDAEQRVHTDCLALVHRSYSAQDAVIVRIDQNLAATATGNTNTTSPSTDHSLVNTPASSSSSTTSSSDHTSVHNSDTRHVSHIRPREHRHHLRQYPGLSQLMEGRRWARLMAELCPGLDLGIDIA